MHYGESFENALWNGRQMDYGHADGRIFSRFTASVDVIAHELTQGVIQFAAALGYHGQTGALNEHLADAFGIMVKQWLLGLTADKSDWLIVYAKVTRPLGEDRFDVRFTSVPKGWGEVRGSRAGVHEDQAIQTRHRTPAWWSSSFDDIGRTPPRGERRGGRSPEQGGLAGAPVPTAASPTPPCGLALIAPFLTTPFGIQCCNSSATVRQRL